MQHFFLFFVAKWRYLVFYRAKDSLFNPSLAEPVAYSTENIRLLFAKTNLNRNYEEYVLTAFLIHEILEYEVWILVLLDFSFLF